MYISSFELINYKSFRHSPVVQLTPGFTVIVGENNVGKSALAEGLSLFFAGVPHLSTLTVPRPGLSPPATSEVAVSLALSDGEFEQMVVDNLDGTNVPLREHEASQNDIQEVFRKATLIRARINAGRGVASAFTEERADVLPNRCLPLQIDKTTRAWRISRSKVLSASASETVFHHVTTVILKRIYRFDAQRFQVGECAFGTSEELASNATNLPEVLNTLQGKAWRFDEFNRLVTLVLPQVQRVSVHPQESQRLQIRIAGVGTDVKRDDLAVPLKDCGTGIGQVLAILYVVLTADFPRTIIIDEPQSFLHPGAARKLIEILGQHRQHQYIITTHSATAISAARPERILLVRKSAAESEIIPLDANATENLRTILVEVGARFSDIFGTENILWVEGPTEESCFPLLIEKVARRLLLGTTVLGVVSTGQLEGKYARTAYEIYTRLTQGDVLLPPALGFIFDREGRTEAEIEDLTKRSSGKARFLPRRMYENYLLHPAAIAAVLTHLDAPSGVVHPETEVADWIKKRGSERGFVDSAVEDAPLAPAWLEHVRAAKLLESLFQELSETRVAYVKTRDSVALTEWLVDNDPTTLRELAEFVSKDLPSAM